MDEGKHNAGTPGRRVEMAIVGEVIADDPSIRNAIYSGVVRADIDTVSDSTSGTGQNYVLRNGPRRQRQRRYSHPQKNSNCPFHCHPYSLVILQVGEAPSASPNGLCTNVTLARIHKLSRLIISATRLQTLAIAGQYPRFQPFLFEPMVRNPGATSAEWVFTPSLRVEIRSQYGTTVSCGVPIAPL